MTRTTYRVTVKKRDGSTIVGTMKDDGLQSLWPITQDDGTVAYASVLDTFLERRRVA